MSNIVVATMGITWQILPKIIGFTNPQVVDLYRFHPSIDRIVRSRSDFSIQPADEMWVITTKGKIDRQIAKLEEWHNLVKPEIKPVLKIFQVDNTDDLNSETECRLMREAILQTILHANEYTADGQLLLVLADGGKTMNSDMQYAASVFGCDALIQLVDNNNYSTQQMATIQDFDPGKFLIPLSADFKDAFIPIIIGKYVKNAMIDLSMTNMFPIRAENYPMLGFENEKIAVLDINPTVLPLSEAVGNRLNSVDYLTGKYVNFLVKDDSDSNFLSLFSLSPSIINNLKQTMIGVHPKKESVELSWLIKLPKAELHCHLDGVMNIKDVIRVANVNNPMIDRYKMRMAFQMREWHRMLQDKAGAAALRGHLPLKTIPEAVRDLPLPVSICSFISLFNGKPELLEELIFGKFQRESAFVAAGYNAYETLGDIQGARLLQNEASLREACRILAEKAVRHNVRYLEVRFSPLLYSEGELNPVQVVQIIEDELNKVLKDFSIILSVDRYSRKPEIIQLVNTAKRVFEDSETPSRLRGFDLAGSEISPIKELRKYFHPIIEHCQHVTTTSFENMDTLNTWEAVYHLNAERVAHCLTLKDNPMLMSRFLDHNVVIELSPSSALQVIGFRDNYMLETQKLPVYPLKYYLDNGLKVTVSTNNPGISRTDFTRELHRAARMTPGGLSLWDILKLVCNGFKGSFADRSIRNRLLREAEAEILDLIQEGLPQ